MKNVTFKSVSALANEIVLGAHASSTILTGIGVTLVHVNL